MRHLTLLISFAMLIGGCSSTLTPPIQEYTIYPPLHSASSPQPLSTKTLRLSPMKTIPSLSSRNLLYLRENGEIGSYLYTRWSDAPSVLLERSLSHTLQEKMFFSTLLTGASSAQSDLLLESDLHAFYHRFDTDRKSQGVIDVTYRLIDAKTKLPIASKRFFITKEASSENAAGGIEALTAATSELTIQCTQWLQEKAKL